jgi:hypothetical protein
MAIPLAEIIKKGISWDTLIKSAHHCPYCGVLLQETITGRRPTPKGDACSDCYYEQLGEIIESSPITSGGFHRG